MPPFFAMPLPAFVMDPPASIANSFIGALVVFLPEETIDPVTFFSRPESFPPVFYLFCAWVLSAGVFVSFSVWRDRALQRSLRSTELIFLPRELRNFFRGTPIKVFAKRGLHSPLLVGVRKPRLYLPENWKTWRSEQLHGVIAHELAHYHNRDLWTLVFQMLMIALFGLNPLVWLVNRRLGYLRELRCDEFALQLSGIAPVEYGKLLYAFLNKNVPSKLSGLSFNRSQISVKKRFENVLSFGRSQPKHVRWHWLIHMCITLAIVPLSIREVNFDFGAESRPIRIVTIDGVDVFWGRNVTIYFETRSVAGQKVIESKRTQIHQVLAYLVGQVNWGGGKRVNLHGGLAEVARDEINLTLGRQWIERVVFEEENSKGLSASKIGGLSPGYLHRFTAF